MILGGTLSICNVYTGLKIGWGLNMSITGILLAFAFWKILSGLMPKVPMLGRLENNVNQTACSAAGSVSSAGLVSAIPALTMIEGTTLEWWQLSVWMMTVCLVGVSVAMGLRKQMIIVDKLPFPGGISCAETLKEIYNTGAEAMRRVTMLAIAAVIGGGIKVLAIMKVIKGTDLGLTVAGGKSAGAYGFLLDPSLLMVAVGGLIGIRGGASLLLGAILAWGVIGMQLVEKGVVSGPGPRLSEWLIWPGVTLMVVSSLVSFSFSAPAIMRSFRRTKVDSPDAVAEADTGEVKRNWFLISLFVALIFAVILQVWFFEIRWWAAAIAVLLSFVLAVVASRVSGETNVTPVGAMGKVTQLAFAGLMPSSTAANLMSASVTAGAASQCADLMHDLKCGYLLGAVARKQVIGQIAGCFAGCLVGSAFYLMLVPDPKTMLLTPEWPAPAVAAWKAVAEVFKNGIDTLPYGTTDAMIYAAILGVLLPVLEKYLPKKAAVWVPSPASLGLAFVIPASNSISMFIGATIALILGKTVPQWTTRFLVTICAGIIAGESLVGAGDAVRVVIDGQMAQTAAGAAGVVAPAAPK